MSRWQRALDAALGRVQWDDRHRTLAAQPVFAACSRTEIRTLVRRGDEVDVEAGEVVLREDRIGYWFFVVLDGSLRLSNHRREVATLGPGSHVGDVAILGFGPQPLTATTVVRSRLYVLGRRDLLHLAHAAPGVRAGLFPGADPEGVTQRIRGLRAEGAMAWAALPRHRHPPPHDGERLPTGFRPANRHRAPAAFPPLAARPPAGDAASMPTDVSRGRPPNVRRRVAASVAAAAACVVAASTYHPPVFVVRPDGVIDAAADIELVGRPRPAMTGRYLLTPVRFDQPNLIGAGWAVATGQQTLPEPASPEDGDVERLRLERQEFARAQRDAVAAAAARLGLAPSTVDVRFRQRDISGPSAGLIYTLALIDMLDPADLAQGRTIAATGALGSDGRIDPVAFVDLKRQAAARAHVTMFIVPAGQGGPTRREGPTVVTVANVEEAIAILRAT